MAGKVLSREEAIALTEKKVAMSLDEIIKMSKKSTFKGRKPARPPIKSTGFNKGGISQSNRSTKVQNFLNSRASIRQGVLAQRRSNMSGNQFPLTTEAARRAASLPIQNREANWNKPRAPTGTSKSGKSQVALKNQGGSRPRQTLDARFASMKDQRIRMMVQQANTGSTSNALVRRGIQMQQQRKRSRTGARVLGNGNRRFANFTTYQ